MPQEHFTIIHVDESHIAFNNKYYYNLYKNYIKLSSTYGTARENKPNFITESLAKI